MAHTEVTISSTNEALNEIFIAELSAIGFDHFLQEEEQLIASVPTESFGELALNEIIERYSALHPQVKFNSNEVAFQNWNKLWESNYPYTIINEDCAIKAPFHQLPKPYRYELIITPKMSFGTGHHATTTLMLRQLMQTDVKRKTVLDLGTGTGVLFIMALKLGASSAVACDIEDWSVENAIENAKVNEVDNFNVFHGTVTSLQGKTLFDVVLANINRNIILEELAAYSSKLSIGGTLITSGFYVEDFPQIREKAERVGLQFKATTDLNKWAVAVFNKER